MDRIGLRKHNHRIDMLANANALVSGIALYPQLFKIFSTHSVSGLAPSTFFLIFISNIIWQAYGWHRKNLPIIISSGLSATAAAAILGLFFLWGNG